jgi:hypothetical protein
MSVGAMKDYKLKGIEFTRLAYTSGFALKPTKKNRNRYALRVFGKLNVSSKSS